MYSSNRHHLSIFVTLMILKDLSDPQMSLLPVCCVAEFDSKAAARQLALRSIEHRLTFFQKFLDRFIELNLKQKEGVDLELSIVIITSLEKINTETSKSPMEPTTSPAPFQGKSPKECFDLLQALAKDTGSELNVENFAILDERSKEDDTVLLVQAFKNSGRIKTVSGALRGTDMALENLWVGNMNIEEFEVSIGRLRSRETQSLERLASVGIGISGAAVHRPLLALANIVLCNLTMGANSG